MNIKRAKEEIKNCIEAYLLKDGHGEYVLPAVRQRPVLLMGPPGIGKTQIMEQIARECQVGLVSYTITHHTRQSAIGLPYIVEKEYGGRPCSVTAYLEARPEHFYKIETTVDGKRFATPRGWEDLARFLEIYEKLGKTVDRDVIYQYIEHPGIAKDFANYLELYGKYKTDYQIERILSGKPDGEMIRRVAAASFDERFSVLSLILAHLNGKFREIWMKEQYLGLMKEELEKFRQMTTEAPRTENPDGADPAGLLKELAARMNSRLEKKRKAGLTGKKEEYLMRDVSEKLEDYALAMEKEPLSSLQDGFLKARELFAAEVSEYESLSEEALRMLEHGFDFMEAAFSAGQEMVIFVTELNTNYYSVNFLRENRCERYYEYNKNLLFEDREKQLFNALQRTAEL